MKKLVHIYLWLQQRLPALMLASLACANSMCKMALPTSVYATYTRVVSPLRMKDAAGTPEVPAPAFHTQAGFLSPALSSTNKMLLSSPQRQPPHNGYKLTELVDSCLRGDERPVHMPPMPLFFLLFLFQTALPTSVHLTYTRAVSPLQPKDAAGTPEVPAPVFHTQAVFLSPALAPT